MSKKFEAKFNFFIPRKWYDDDKVPHYSLCKIGERMKVDTLDEMQSYVSSKFDKLECAWGQVFNNGIRVGNDNKDWTKWNGFVFSDIDSKHYYEHRKFDPDLLENAIHKACSELYPFNYYCVYKSFSGNSYRIFWYFDCERTEDNFNKCIKLMKEFVIKAFESFNAKDIIECKGVWDPCSKSALQGFYMTSNKIYYNDICDDYGKCDLSAVKPEQAAQRIIEYRKYIKPHNKYNVDYIVTKTDVCKDNIEYLPHQRRRCLYDSLAAIYDKKELNDEWEYVTQLMIEDNGHTKRFYQKEPDKNRWQYDPFDEYFDTRLLKMFGYNVEVKKSIKVNIFNDLNLL